MKFQQKKIKEKNKLGFKLKKSISKRNGVEIINHILKRIGFWFIITFLPILFLIIIAAVIIAAILWFIPKSSAATDLNNFFVNTMQLNLAGSLVETVIDIVMAILYLIFIQPIVWVANSLQTIVFFLGGGALSNKFFTNNAPALFWLILGVSCVILIIALSIKAIEWMQSRNMQSVKSTSKNALLVLIGMAVIPVTFFLLNLIMVSVAKIFISNIGQNENLALDIFNSSFMNGVHNFTYIPDSYSFPDHTNFSYFICLISECFLTYILLLITIQLFFKIFELFILYTLAPWVLISSITDEGRKFSNWKELVLNRFFGFSLLYLAFNVFISAIPVIVDVSTLIPDGLAQPIFITVGILALGLTVAKFPQLLGSILGGRTSLTDSIGNLMGLGMATSGLFGGVAAGYKSLRFGLKKGSKALHRGTAGIRGIHTARKAGTNFFAATTGATVGGLISKFTGSHALVHDKTLSNIDSMLNLKKKAKLEPSSLAKDLAKSKTKGKCKGGNKNGK